MPRYLAVDLGAGSGRGVLGTFDGERVGLREVHRFPTAPVRLADGLHTDLPALHAEVLASLRRAVADGDRPDSLGIDGWGVDFGLLDAHGSLLGLPRHHRDERHRDGVERLLARVPAAEAYDATGTQLMPINTICQLLTMEGSAALRSAATLLPIPDLLTFELTGERAAELTNASTTQMLDPVRREWAAALLARLGIPREILPELVEPGTRAGALLPRVAEAAGVPAEVPVVRVASHDTASAVVAVPAEGSEHAYISCGTWSLVGVEVDDPVLSPAALAANLTNELGFGGRVRLLKNVMGLWLLQQSRAELAGPDSTHAEVVELARRAPDGGPLFDPDRPELLAPGPMLERIRAAIGATGQRAPQAPGALARAILESLACKYRLVLEGIERAAGLRARAIHVVGGGALNDLLCALTAAVCARPVLAGPVEATALGNVMVQAWHAGEVGSLAQIRAVVRASARPRTYAPERVDRGEELYRRFVAATGLRAPAGESGAAA